MGLAEDLQRFHELHEKGQLTDQEYAQVKAAAIKKMAPESGNRKFGRAIGSRIIPLLVVLFVILAYVWYRTGTEDTSQLLATAVHAPITLTDEVQNLPASSMKGLPINLPYDGTLNINLQVVRGNPIDVFLTDANQAQAVQEAEQKGDWHNIKSYNDFNAQKTETYRRTGRFRSRRYYLVMRDPSLGILSSSASDISVKVQLNP